MRQLNIQRTNLANEIKGLIRHIMSDQSLDLASVDRLNAADMSILAVALRKFPTAHRKAA